MPAPAPGNDPPQPGVSYPPPPARALADDALPISTRLPTTVPPPRPESVPADWPLTPGLRPPWIDERSLPVLRPRTTQPWFLFETDPFDLDYGHPLWLEHTNTVPSIRADCRFIAGNDGRHTWNKATGPDDTVRSTILPLVLLLDKVARHFGPRNRPFHWFCIPASFGAFNKDADSRDWPNIRPLLNQPRDRLRSGRRAPWAWNGIRENRRWAREYLEELAAELKHRKLPDPIAFMLTSENGPGDDFLGHVGSPDTGWVPEALADDRARDAEHTIDGRRTFAQYMQEARTIDGRPVPEFTQDVAYAVPPGRSWKNAESTDRYRGALRLLWDWATFASFGSIARAAFARDASKPEATVLVGEYGSACDSKRSPVRVSPGIWQHSMDGVFYSDVQCPECYGPVSWNRPEEPFGREGGWPTMKNWRRVYPKADPATPDDDGRITIDTHIAMATQHALAAPDRPLAPYLTYGHGISLDGMVEYVRACRALGAVAFNVFLPERSPAALRFWKQVLERTS